MRTDACINAEAPVILQPSLGMKQRLVNDLGNLLHQYTAERGQIEYKAGCWC